MSTRLNIDDKHDRRRWLCPNGHRSWEPTNGHFWCKYCAREDGEDGVFHELHDSRSGETVPREDLELVTDAGPYRNLRSV
jgi:hypothetical protein